MRITAEKKQGYITKEMHSTAWFGSEQHLCSYNNAI